MNDLQRSAFDWIVCQPALTVVAILVGGLLCAVTGARFTRFLVAVFAVAGGSTLGLALAMMFGVSPVGMIAALAFAAGFAAILWPMTMLVTLSGLGWGAIATYVLHQVGIRGEAALVAFAVGFAGGCVLTALNRATMTVFLTSVIGSAIIIVGFVGLSNGLFPLFGGTFRALANSQPLTIPILLGMLTVTTYSYQANSFRGDIITGAVPESAA